MRPCRGSMVARIQRSAPCLVTRQSPPGFLQRHETERAYRFTVASAKTGTFGFSSFSRLVKSYLESFYKTDFARRAQLIAATLACSLSAGVIYPKVFLGC